LNAFGSDARPADEERDHQPAAMPPKPSTPAMIAMMKNTTA
jgi:hypothetical protein